MWNLLDAYLMANQSTITISEAALIADQMDALYSIMTAVNGRAAQ